MTMHAQPTPSPWHAHGSCWFLILDFCNTRTLYKMSFSAYLPDEPFSKDFESERGQMTVARLQWHLVFFSKQFLSQAE